METDFRADGVGSGVGPNATARLDNTVTNNLFPLVKVLFKTDPEIKCCEKVILSGHFIEVYKYQKPITLNRKPGRKKTVRPELAFEVAISRIDEYRKRSKNRVIGNVQRLVETNFNNDSIFLTLTFNNSNKFDISELKICNLKFHRFIVKLKKKFDDLKYLAVPEFQERGAVHYHIIINKAFIKKKILQKLWKYGFIKVKNIYYLNGIGNYFTKYLTKNVDDKRLWRKRSYFTSKNLRHSKTVYGEYANKIINRLDEKDIFPYYVKHYESEFNGMIEYKKFHIDTKI